MSDPREHYYISTSRCGDIERALERVSDMVLRIRLGMARLRVLIEEEHREDGRDPFEWAGLVRLEDVQREHVIGVYNALGKNKARAARVLGVDVKTVRRIIKNSLEGIETDPQEGSDDDSKRTDRS